MNPWIIILLAIGLAGGGYYEGWSMRGDHDKALVSDAEKAAREDYDKKLAAETKRGDDLAVKLDLEKQNIKFQTIEVIKEVPKVTTVYREAPNAPLQVIPDPVFTRGFVRLWDSALFASSSLPQTGIEPVDQAGGTYDLIRAKISSADILVNHTENAGKWADCRAQLNKLIDFEDGRSSP